MLRPDSINGIDGIPTPFYYYDIDLLGRTLDELVSAAERYDYRIHYAFKANTDKRILGLIKDAGLGADCVSGNEVLNSFALMHRFL